MLNGRQLFLRQRFIHRRKFPGNEAVEFCLHISQLLLQRVDTRHLIIGRTAFVEDKVRVEASGLFADVLFPGNGAAFFRSHNFLAQLIDFLRQVLQLLREGRIVLDFAAAVSQSVAHAVDAVDVKTHVAEQIVDAHGSVQIELAVIGTEFRARIKRNIELCCICPRAPGQLHCVGAGQHARALCRFEGGRGSGRNARRLDAHGPFDAADAAAAVR